MKTKYRIFYIISLLLYINCGTSQSTDQSTFSRPYTIEPHANDWGSTNVGEARTLLAHFFHSLRKKSIKTPIETPIEPPSIEDSGMTVEDDLITPIEEDPSDLQTRIDSPSGNEIMPNNQYKEMDNQGSERVIKAQEKKIEDKAARITEKKEDFNLLSKKGGFRINPRDDALRRTGTDRVVVDPPKEKKSWFYKIFNAVFKAASGPDDNSGDEDSSRDSDRGKEGIISKLDKIMYGKKVEPEEESIMAGFDRFVYGDKNKPKEENEPEEESILAGFDRFVYGDKNKPKKVEPEEESILAGFDEALDSLNFKFWEW